MPEIHEAEHGEDVVEQLIAAIEKSTSQEVFTIKILEEAGQEDGSKLEVLIVFTDKSILMGHLKVQTIEGKLAVRVQGNYL